MFRQPIFFDGGMTKILSRLCLDYNAQIDNLFGVRRQP
jgi:hypothetical protein